MLFFIVFTILLTFCFNNDYFLKKFEYLKPEEIYIFYFLSIGMLLGIFRTQFSSIILGFNQAMNYSVLNLFHIIVTNSTLALLIYYETTKEVLSLGFFLPQLFLL